MYARSIFLLCSNESVHCLNLFVRQGKKWWQTADSPWQTLACCMELASAVRSGDPEGYISHIPVHQVQHHLAASAALVSVVCCTAVFVNLS